MARSTRIYVVEDWSYEPHRTLAVFTVRHECETFLKRLPDLIGVYVDNLPDGRAIDLSHDYGTTAVEFIA